MPDNERKKEALKGLAADLKQRFSKRPPGETDGPEGATSLTRSEFLQPPPQHETSEVVELALERIDPSPYQPRTRELSKKDVEELMVAISANGQVQPIVVCPSDQQGRYVVHSGHRRCAALRFLGVESVRAIVRELTEREARRLVVGDNLGRKDLSAMEKAVALKQYCEAYEDIDFEAAARELGVKRATAYRLKTLIEASEELQDLIGRASIPARPAATLVKLEAKEPRRARRLAEKWADGKLTAAELEQAAKKTRTKRVAPQARPTADFKMTERELRLAVNLTRAQVNLAGNAVDEAVEAIGKFVEPIGYRIVPATDTTSEAGLP